MRIQRTTWGLLITSIILGVVVYYYESQLQPQKETISQQNKKLFEIQEKDIKTLTIKTSENILKFEKKTNENQPWQMKEPKDKVANDAVISFLTNLLATSEVDRTFSVPKTQKKDYGLEQPLATINFELNNSQKHQIILGNAGFQEDLIYAQVDPKSQSGENITISLVPKSFQYALDRKPDEWVEKATLEPSIPNTENQDKNPSP